MNVSFINCCAVPLHYIAHSFCPATLNGVLGSCLQKSKFYRGVPEPPGTPPPYAPELPLFPIPGKVYIIYDCIYSICATPSNSTAVWYYSKVFILVSENTFNCTTPSNSTVLYFLNYSLLVLSYL